MDAAGGFTPGVSTLQPQRDTEIGTSTVLAAYMRLGVCAVSLVFPVNEFAIIAVSFGFLQVCAHWSGVYGIDEAVLDEWCAEETSRSVTDTPLDHQTRRAHSLLQEWSQEVDAVLSEPLTHVLMGRQVCFFSCLDTH
jgi:hypothetical protein